MVTSLYAVVAPDNLLGLWPSFWGSMLFASVLSFTVGFATDRRCAAGWGYTLLALSIIWTIAQRGYHAGNFPHPIAELDFLQVFFAALVCTTTIITGVTMACKRADEREQADNQS